MAPVLAPDRPCRRPIHPGAASTADSTATAELNCGPFFPGSPNNPSASLARTPWRPARGLHPCGFRVDGCPHAAGGGKLTSDRPACRLIGDDPVREHVHVRDASVAQEERPARPRGRDHARHLGRPLVAAEARVGMVVPSRFERDTSMGVGKLKLHAGVVQLALQVLDPLCGLVRCRLGDHPRCRLGVARLGFPGQPLPPSLPPPSLPIGGGHWPLADGRASHGRAILVVLSTINVYTKTRLDGKENGSSH